MATGRILLPFPGGLSPSGQTAGWQKIKSSGGPVTNGPAVATARMYCDAAADQHWVWPLVLPGDANATPAPVVRFKWGADVTTGNVIWKAAFVAIRDGTDNTGTVSFNTVIASTATAVPGTVGLTAEMTLTPDATNVAANRLLMVMLGRDADAAGDTAAGNAWITGAILEYTI